jgi:hypothetical protein
VHCVAQVFVANPNKPQAVIDILVNNKEKLLNYLEVFHNEKGAHPPAPVHTWALTHLCTPLHPYGLATKSPPLQLPPLRTCADHFASTLCSHHTTCGPRVLWPRCHLAYLCTPIC